MKSLIVHENATNDKGNFAPLNYFWNYECQKKYRRIHYQVSRYSMNT